MEDNTVQHHLRSRDSVSRNYSFGVLAAILVIASFIGGVFVGGLRPTVSAGPQVTAADLQKSGTGQVTDKNAPPPYALKDVDFAKFWDVWQTVKERFAKDKPTDSQMFYGAVEGMVASLKDPYSVFFDPQLAQKFDADLKGTFEGIGAEVGIRNDTLTIISPLDGSPAMKAGIKAGDRILQIDGQDTSGLLLEEAVAKIRGPKGTTVKLMVFREGMKQAKEYPIVRSTIVVDPVKLTWKEKDGKKIAVIAIRQFNEETAPKFTEAVRKALLQNPAGLVLDLRNNPGGFLDTAVKVAGEWTPNAVIVSERFSDGKEQKYNAPMGGQLGDMPTVVLVNGGSASASEIVSGALQDYGKAILVGEKTFGKGSVQDYMSYDDNSALKLTVALWYTPKGRSIEKQGIDPDIDVKLSADDINADKDPQLDVAVQAVLDPSAARTAAAALQAEAKTAAATTDGLNK